MSSPQEQGIPAPLTGLPELLLPWYDRNARVLPWRQEPTPYRVWISEIMLQQTRVEAGKPYFERFISCLPDVQALAEADEALLLKLWEGLGYYSRVRNLHKAAQMVMERWGGQLPDDPALLRTLPGVGGYTAGAIASIAFGHAVPAVDGNVLRVTARLLEDHRDMAAPQVKREVEKWIGQIIPRHRPGDFNQALMDLGAMVCLPGGVPLCEKCPAAAICMGRASGRAASLPVKAAKPPRPAQSFTVLLLTRGDRVALRKRPSRGLLAGMWEFPMAEGLLSGKEAAAVAESWGTKPLKPPRDLGPARHIFTHVRWDMTGWQIEVENPCGTEDFTWVSTGELSSAYALPSAFRHYMEALALPPSR